MVSLPLIGVKEVGYRRATVGVNVECLTSLPRESEILDGKVSEGHFLVSPVAEPCPPEAAVCLLNGSKPVNLGRVRDGPQWRDGITILTYVDGDLCPDQIRKKSTTIRLTCSENQVVSDAAPQPPCCALGTGGIEGSVSRRLTSLGWAWKSSGCLGLSAG